MSRKMIKKFAWLVPTIAFVAATCARQIHAQQAATSKAPDITGSWERYRGARRSGRILLLRRKRRRRPSNRLR